MKENKVYVVSSGDYSDYEIDSIFSSREKAEEYINHSTNMGLNGIDEWVLDEKKPDKRKKIFSVISDFDTIDFHVCGRGYYSIEYKDLMQYNSGWYICFYIYTDTRERAIKIASERLRQIKAEEHFRYPLLRRPVITSYGQERFPLTHYHTGEIILEEDSKLAIENIPSDYRSILKVVTMEELKERYKDLNNKEESEWE